MATAIDPRQRFQRAQAAKCAPPSAPVPEPTPGAPEGRRSPHGGPVIASTVPVLCAKCRRRVGDRLGLTARQAEVLAYLRSYIAANGIAPMLQEIAAALGVHITTVHSHISALENKGYLRRAHRCDRGITLCD